MSDPSELTEQRYGKERIRLVRVIRGAGRHTVRDLTVAVSLEGAFEAAYLTGDNGAVVATDTMKNTVYALAGDGLTGPPERFGIVLAQHFLEAQAVRRAAITIEEADWRALEVDGTVSADAFARDDSSTRTARVIADGRGVSLSAGLAGLTVMKTAHSSFRGFPRDRYTTLPETDDRILATRLEAEWRYGPAGTRPDLDFEATYGRVRETLLSVFASHHSPSVQSTIWTLGQAVLDAVPTVDQIHLVLPNLHHWLVDLSPYGMTNDGSVFVATNEPFGIIEGTISRGDQGA